uniref:Extended synaptotagmin-like protein 1a n=1 Tax=Pygocentrus nattereri TaxID=42514 RepID=A0AAR2K8C1_PYGNA
MAVGEDAGSASAETPGRHAVSVLLAFGKCLGALLPVYLAGYFGLSLCFVVLGLVVYLGWRQHRDGKQARLNTAMYVLENERDFTTTRLFRSRRDLPAWVNFPDVEKVEWLNKILQQAWPFVGQYLEKLLVETIAPTIRTSSAHLQTFSFTKVDLGDKAVKVVGVKAHTEHDKRQVLLDLYISYAGNVEINVEIKKYFCKAGVKGIQLHGKLRVILEPLIGDVPLVGAVTMFFIRRPKLDINWTGLTNLLDIPCLNAMSDTMVMDAIASFLVLPNRLTVPLVADLHVAQLRSPLPRGIVRIHLVEAENLAAKDTFIKGVIAGKSDPYAVLRVGTQTFTSHHVDNNLNPQWREMYEVIVHEVPGQELEVEVFDKDPDQDDFLGRYYCSLDLGLVKESRVLEEWFTLKDAPSGKVHLRLEWLSLLPSAERLNEKNQNLTVSSKTPDPPSAAILTVYLDQAQDLPVKSFHSTDFALPLHVICGILIRGCSVGSVLMQMKKGNKDPSPMVQLSVQDTTKESRTVYGTNNPVWEDAFTFFIQDPRKQDLDIQVKDDDRSLTLGTLSIPLSRLLSSTELSMDQWFQLDNSGPASRIYMNAVLRVRLVHPIKDVPAAKMNLISVYDLCQFTDTFVRACCACFCVCRGGVAGDSGRGQVKVTIAYSAEENRLVIIIHACRNLPPCSKDGSDPYVSFLLQPDKNRSTKRKTSIKKRDLNPEFNERFDFDLSLEEATQRRLDLSVKNSVSFMSRERELIGKVLSSFTY